MESVDVRKKPTPLNLPYDYTDNSPMSNLFETVIHKFFCDSSGMVFIARAARRLDLKRSWQHFCRARCKMNQTSGVVRAFGTQGEGLPAARQLCLDEEIK